LTAVQGLFRRHNRGRMNVLPVVAGLCLVLLATLSIAQVTHLHANAVDADHCQLCIVMHTAAPVAVVAAAIVLVELGTSAPQAEPTVIARQRHSRIFIRPPPVSC
jgi:uncharacterized membrane protein YqhA